MAEWFELACDGDARLLDAFSGMQPSHVAFDAQHDAVWVGWADGMMSSYDVFNLTTPHSSFKAHPGAVLQMTSLGMAGTLSVSATHVCLHGLGGAPYASAHLFDNKENKKLTSTLALDHTRFVVGCDVSSNGNSLYELDLSRIGQDSGQFLHKFGGASYDHGVSMLCPTMHGAIVCGHTDGKLGLVDLRLGHASGAPVVAHAGSITDLDAVEQTVVTCGTAADGRIDPFVKIFDVRMHARVLGVLQVGARFVRFVASQTPRAMFTGDMGDVHVYSDLNMAPNARLEQLEQMQSGGGTVTGMATSTMGRAAVFCDSAGFVHLWTDDDEWADSTRKNINMYSEPMEEHPPPSFAASEKKMSALEFWDEQHFDLVSESAFLENLTSPLEATLCSQLPPMLMTKAVHEKNPREIHPSMLSRAQTQRDFLGQFIETSKDEFVMNHALIFGKTSGKDVYMDGDAALAMSRNLKSSEGGENGGEAPSDPGEPSSPGRGAPALHAQHQLQSGSSELSSKMRKLKAEIPGSFVQPKLTLSKVGLTDFDYGKYNSTPFTGLEANVPNSFSNAVLQVLYFIPELRGLLTNFVTADPSCLATEASFLFHMMDQACSIESSNKTCEARNLLRTFRLAPEAQALGLLEPTQLENDRRAGAFIRFVLEQFGRSDKAVKLQIATCFGIHLSHREKWLMQGIDDSHRSSVSLALDMVYPSELNKAILTGTKLPNLSFLDILKLTFTQSQKTRLWCKQKNEQLPVVQSRNVTQLSQYLIVNASSHDNRSVYLPLYREKARSGKRFVPWRFKVEMDKGGNVSVVEASPGETSDPTGQNSIVYELCAVVSHVYPTENLVAHIKVPESYAKRASEAATAANPTFVGNPVAPGAWLLFNDFKITELEGADPEEVVDFRNQWRNPSIFVYRKRLPSAVGGGDVSPVPTPSQTTSSLTDKDVFLTPSLSRGAPKGKPTFEQLALDKLPGKGDLVSIDCEMVALSTEEFYTNTDGLKVVTQQSQLSLARVSCTTEDETVFVDDYIVTPDPVVDYLTRFSGLTPGDLDPATSPHHLVPLRIAYLKLRRLVDRGCIFVGHGLRKDFRVINILVPPQQIHDTVHLFHLPSNRYLSLSFLASYLLNLDIQGKTHDSIEDARTSLRLFKEYKRLEQDGALEAKLTEIYVEGRKRNFR